MSTRAGDPPSGESPWLRVSPASVTVEIIAHPGASRSAIRSATERGLIVDAHATVERGKANAELIATIAQALDVPRSAVTIIRGKTSRHKTLRIETVRPALLAKRLRSIGNPPRSAISIRSEETTNR
jgi:uncharacterized protein